MVDLGGVLIESCGGLSSQVAVPHIEVERGDAVMAAGAGELHAAGDSFRGVIPHALIVVAGAANWAAPGVGDEGNARGAQVGLDRARGPRLSQSQHVKAVLSSESGRCTITSAEMFLGGGKMDSWKKAAILGSIGAAGILFMKKRYPAGVLATGVGLAVLASEYPEKFEKVRRSLPDYFDRGMRVMEMAGRAGRRITDAAGHSAAEAWEEIGG